MKPDWWRPTWCSSAADRRSATSVFMSATDASCTPRPRAEPSVWIGSTAPTGETTTAAPDAYFTNLNRLHGPVSDTRHTLIQGFVTEFELAVGLGRAPSPR